MTAADDPFVDAAAYAGAALGPSLTLHVEPTGGHVAYLERRGAGYGRWLDGALVHYVETLAAGAFPASPRDLPTQPSRRDRS